MAPIRSCVVELRADRLLLRRYLLCLILGALLGALFARLTDPASVFGSAAVPRRETLWVGWLRGALLPCLLAAAAALRLHALFPTLFFAKGAAVAWLLCDAVPLGPLWLRQTLPAVLFETVLPLPLLLTVSAIWAGAKDEERPALWLLAPLLLASLAGALLHALYGAIFG